MDIHIQYMTVYFEPQITITLAVDIDYPKTLALLQPIESILLFKNAHDGYFTTIENAISNYREVEFLAQMTEDEASFAFAAKEAGYEEFQTFSEIGKHYEGYDKTLYPDGLEFE